MPVNPKLLPDEIAVIIRKIGVTDLSVSEKRKLLHWYNRSASIPAPQFTAAEAFAIEERIFNYIQCKIDKK